MREWRLAALEEILDVAQRLLEETTSSEMSRSLGAQVIALRSFTAFMISSDYPRALSLAQEALQKLPDTERGALGLATFVMVLVRQMLGDRESTIHSLEAVVHSLSQTGPSQVQAFVGLATIHQMAGDLQSMSRETELFLAFAARQNHPNAQVVANRVAGWLNYEWNDLEPAERQFSVAVAQRYRSNFLAYFESTLGLVKIHLALGRSDEAQRILADLRAETLRLNNGDLLGPIEAFQAHLRIIQGDLPAAVQWARSTNPDELHESVLLSDAASLNHARVMIWGGTIDELQTTVDFLRAKIDWSEKYHYKQRVIQTQLHLALALKKQGDFDQAKTILEQALNLAQPGGFIRTYLDLGQPMSELLNDLNSRLPLERRLYVDKILAGFKVDKLVIPSFPAPRSPLPSNPLSPITKREMEVLVLMQAGKSDSDIADELVIALSTARRHASNIYRKLGVNNRWQAVNEAKMIGLISVE